MATYLAKMGACCPTRTTLLRVVAETEAEARAKALKHCNRGPFRKDWKINNIRPVATKEPQVAT